MPIEIDLPLQQVSQAEFGKMINFGGEVVEHEFVNCHETTEHRRSFRVNLSRWSLVTTDAQNFQTMVLDLLRDWGTGLDQGLYHEAITHFLGGSQFVRRILAWQCRWQAECGPGRSRYGFRSHLLAEEG